MFNSLCGFEIIEDENMVDCYTEEVLLGWKERLLTFKWFTKYKIVQKTRPRTDAIRWEDKLIMHPEIALKLKYEIDRRAKL